MWRRTSDEAAPLLTPPIKHRDEIVASAHATLPRPSGERLYALLKTRYEWTGLQTACIRQAHRALANQMERAHFPKPPYLYPADKGAWPLCLWSIDCIVRLRPPRPSDGADSVIVAVDPFSKWVEAKVVANLQSSTTMTFLHEEIVCRYGLPQSIRRDQGPEFEGRFSDYCK